MSRHVTGMSPPRGVKEDPKDLAVGSFIGPNRFGVWLHESEGGRVGVGLMKPRRGYTLVAGKENLGWARFPLTVDRGGYIFNPSFYLQNERMDAKDG
jgi:hypothetical protein